MKRQRKIDLVFLVQSAGKAGLINWILTKLLIKSIVGKLNVSPGGSRVGLVVEGSNFQALLGLDSYRNKKLLMAVMGLLPYPFGFNSIGKGLRDVESLVFKPANRKGVPKVVIALCFQKSSDDVMGPANELKKLGAEMYAVGLGPKCPRDQLRKIASTPSDKHMFRVKFPRISGVAHKIMGGITAKYFPESIVAQMLKILGRVGPRGKKISDGIEGHTDGRLEQQQQQL